jgi:hypothetical protein
VKEDREPVMLRRLHQRIDLFFVVCRAVLDQRMNFDSLEAQFDTFFQHLKGILRTVSRTQPHETVNAIRVLFHCAGDVLVGLPVIRRLSDTDRKSYDSVHPGIVHRLQHILSHELHNRRDLMYREFFSCAHMRVRIDDFDSLSFYVNHGYLLLQASKETYRIESFLSRRFCNRSAGHKPPRSDRNSGIEMTGADFRVGP